MASAPISPTGPVRPTRNPVGLISLAVAACGFLFFTLQPWLPLGGIRVIHALSLKRLLLSFFDASLVGALADWFAVSALFAHPLGLRLPHTNILARNRDRIAEAVPRFLAGFLTEGALEQLLSRPDYASRTAELVRQPEVRAEIRNLLRRALISLGGMALSNGAPSGMSLEIFVGGALDLVAQKEDPASLFAGPARWILHERLHERAIIGAAALVKGTLAQKRDNIVAFLSPIMKRNAGWQGIFVGKRAIGRLVDGFGEELGRVSTDSDSEVRTLLSGSFAGLVAKLEGTVPDPSGLRQRLGEGIRGICREPSVRAAAVRLLASALGWIASDAATTASRSLRLLDNIVDGFSLRLTGDRELRARVNVEFARLSATFIVKTHVIESVSAQVAGLLKSTDEREFVGRVREAVSNDLQFIRLNGAVVGGLVGLFLAFLEVVVP